MRLQTDSRQRISLPSNLGIMPGDFVELEVLDDGRILLVPIKLIPKHQLWAWTMENKAAITASLTDPRPSSIVENSAEAKTTNKRWSAED